MKKESLSFCLLGTFFATTTFAQLSPEVMCEQVQRVLIGDDTVASGITIKSENFTDVFGFINSKSDIKNKEVSVTSYVPKFSETMLNYGTLWCKMKTQTAIDTYFGYDRLSVPRDCSDVQQQWVSDIVQNNPYLQPVAEKMVYTTQEHRVGFSWAPSQVRMEQSPEQEGYLMESQSLMTPDWVPGLGGMHYCKMLSATGLQDFMQDIYAQDFDKVEFKLVKGEDTQTLVGPDVYGTDIKWLFINDRGESMPYTARVIARAYELDKGYQGALIISPGGQLESGNYRVLAKELALAGWVVFVVDYPYNLAILDMDNAAIDLARHIKSPKITEQLPLALQNVFMEEQFKVVGLGHSLGGAVWGPLLNQETSPFDALLFYGVNGLIHFNKSNFVADNVHFLFGRDDSVAFSDYSSESFVNFMQPFGVEKSEKAELYRHPSKNVSMQVLPDMTHFCIISDREAGLAPIRFLDGTPRAFKPCIENLVTAINQVTLN